VLYNLYTNNIPVPGPHIASGKTPQKKEKPFHRERREETFRRATEEEPSPRMDRSNRCHVYGMNSVTCRPTGHEASRMRSVFLVQRPEKVRAGIHTSRKVVMCGHVEQWSWLYLAAKPKCMVVHSCCHVVSSHRDMAVFKCFE